MSNYSVTLRGSCLWLSILTLLGSLLGLTGYASPAWARAANGVDRNYTMQSGGRERSYRLYLPAGYDPSRPLPLVVVLHGGFGTGAGMERLTGFDNIADSARFIVAYPNGVHRSWNAGDKCCDPARRLRVDDIGFMRDLVDKIEHDYTIDNTRVYGAGFSNGAMLLLFVGCQAPDIFTAIAVNSGALMSSTCNGGRVPTLLIHGRDDPRIPWNGGYERAGGFQEPTYRQPFLTLVKKIAKRNGCSQSQTITYDKPPTECKTYQGCGADEVTWCGVVGVGHQWVGGKTVMPRLLGKNTDRFSSTDMMWTFFSRHQRAGR